MLEEKAFGLVLGKDLVTQVKELTTALFGAHDDALALFQENVAAVEVFASIRFPKRRRPKMEIIPIEERK